MNTEKLKNYFAGKRITQMGLGLLGRGIGDARFLAEQGAELIVTDMKSEEELASSVAALQGLPITFHLGGHTLGDFRDRDLILKAPKTPLDSIYIAEAEKNGIHVTMSTALFARYAKDAGATVIGITGTRGKTTTTHMIAHILKAAGKKVLIGGNIQSVSTLALLPEVDADTIAVLELDSWQLQGFGAEKMSPHVAVFTTFFPDHQDYYPNMDVYLQDKAQIFLYQGTHDVLVLGEQVRSLIEGKFTIRSRVEGAGTCTLPDVVNLQIPGVHNQYAARLAEEAAHAVGISYEESRAALKSFEGVPGRLQRVREVNGVQFYNDTTATTPEATLAALRALDPEGTKNIVLIMGGADKGLDMNALCLEIPRHVKRLIMLSGTGTNRALEFLSGASVYDSFDAAFAEAVHAAEDGDIVLLSPAFASFGMFANEYDRGEQFNAAVARL